MKYILGWIAVLCLVTTVGADELKFSQVMREFGVSLVPADMVTLSDPRDVSDDKLISAIDGLDRAIDVADQVLESPCSAILMPRKFASLSVAEALSYAQKYTDWMRTFQKSLTKYRELFETQLATPVGERDFTSLRAQRDEVRQIAVDSHTNL